MRVEGVSGAGVSMQTPVTQSMDAESRNIQKQIQNKQQELQGLSENERMTPEEKMKKRQEIQQEISSLNMQLRQHQLEQRQKQQDNGTSMDDLLGGNRKAQPASKSGKNSGKADMLSQTSMKGIISADTSMQQAQVQGSVATQMEDRAGVLKAEIERDKASGANTELAEQELADVNEKAQKATAGQMNSLGEANKTLEKTREEEVREKEDKDGEMALKKDEEAGSSAESGQSDIQDAASAYVSVDVRV